LFVGVEFGSQLAIAIRNVGACDVFRRVATRHGGNAEVLAAGGSAIHADREAAFVRDAAPLSERERREGGKCRGKDEGGSHTEEYTGTEPDVSIKAQLIRTVTGCNGGF
jgi:hypothetical protein